MQLTYERNYDGVVTEETLEVKREDFYETVSRMMGDEQGFQGSATIIATTPDGYVKYKITKRSGTNCTTELKNTLPSEYLDEGMKKKYLNFVQADGNSYKFYELTPYTGAEAEKVWNAIPEEKKKYLKGKCNKGDAFFKAEWGRMAKSNGFGGKQHCYYPVAMYWVKYFEKVGKGYVDRSEEYYAESEEVHATSANDTDSGRLYVKLLAFATHTVRNAKVSVPLNSKIIDSSKALLKKLYMCKDMEAFNDTILSLMAILQRPVEMGDGLGVKRMLATSESDFARIIQREEDLILSMEGMIGKGSGTSGDFSDYGIKVYMATDKQKQQVMRKLSDELKPKVKNIYRVIPASQKKKFNQYLEDKGISTVKMLWHGSRNENWLSIIKSSLQLNPNAIITGKMFGDGIYFAPSSMKSWNYTSMRGSYWAKGNSDTAFMGLYAVAYGTPYDVNSYSSSMDYKDTTLKSRCDCLFAHKGTMLRNDEIVFYDEAAILLNYIVEFEG